jgi:hypothetical protein
MGIDGIGRKPPPPPSLSKEGAAPARPAEASRPFEVGKAARPTSTAEPGAVDRLASASLERLRAGEIDLHGYVELKVNEATAHLAALPPSQLEAIRGALRARIASDPTLLELVRKATGSVPTPPADD